MKRPLNIDASHRGPRSCRRLGVRRTPIGGRSGSQPVESAEPTPAHRRVGRRRIGAPAGCRRAARSMAMWRQSCRHQSLDSLQLRPTQPALAGGRACPTSIELGSRIAMAISCGLPRRRRLHPGAGGAAWPPTDAATSGKDVHQAGRAAVGERELVQLELVNWHSDFAQEPGGGWVSRVEERMAAECEDVGPQQFVVGQQ